MSGRPARRVLLVAFHFPPLAGSSGIQRTLRLAQQLPAYGWQPVVLSAHPRAYERTSDDLNAEVPPGTVVRRAFALDTARHLSIQGRYVGAWARPDRWVSWRFDAVRQGMALIRELAPQVIWSTYPIATAHSIGAALQRRSGLPWIADFRDPMAQEGYPADKATWLAYERIEKAAMRQARLATFTTPGAAREYAARYPHAAQRIRVLENGYDEQSFPAAGTQTDTEPLNPGAVTLLHSGIVYPSERDPTSLFAALRLLHERGHIREGGFKLRLRACAAEGFVQQLAAQYRVEAYVETLPPVPYRQALAEMLRADALLVMQAPTATRRSRPSCTSTCAPADPSCAWQIPRVTPQPRCAAPASTRLRRSTMPSRLLRCCCASCSAAATRWRRCPMRAACAPHRGRNARAAWPPGSTKSQRSPSAPARRRAATRGKPPEARRFSWPPSAS